MVKSYEEKKDYILTFIFALYEEQKKSKKCNAFRFYDILSLEEARKEFIDILNLDYNLENIKLYNDALSEFKRLFCTGPRPIEKIKKQKGIGFFKGALAVFLGISEGLEKK